MEAPGPIGVPNREATEQPKLHDIASRVKHGLLSGSSPINQFTSLLPNAKTISEALTPSDTVFERLNREKREDRDLIMRAIHRNETESR